ncbi:hypothetical protein CVIRNUC_004869 [Coccomyxa viridis]|uniref:SET domain-containing protein n=1 Tax=Coccomyxa viridis TaxID=1274662 RepID=A0AAV1I483_9CHLO|nr:hypothetical protein CVIRNUC_004869 [Coccomyxa viridis]
MAASNSNERTIVTARPCVAGSSIMAVAWPDALTAQDALLQLHSHEDRGREELGRLRNPALAVAVGRERLRLSWLHAHLFRQDDGVEDREPAVSLESFLWAHCLVRSRAFELTAGLAEGHALHERCMLPVIDLCNHDGVGATCRLSVRLSPAGAPRAVHLVAARDLEAGEELTLDYGRRPLRDMLRGYGFTPANAAQTDPSEVYEEIGEACEALIVHGSGRGSLFRLQEVRVLGKPGVSQLLELAGQATICYVVKDEASDNAKHIASAPLLQLEGRGISDDASDTSIAAKAGAAADFKRRGLAGTGASSGATLQPEAERGIARRLAGMCREGQQRLALG